MGKLQKLSQGHLDAIYRRSAMGHGPTRIAKALAAGLLNDAGTELSPVEITPPGVRYHLHTPDAQTAVGRWRTELYGDLYADPLAWPGCRISELAELFRHAKERALEPSASKAEEATSQRWARIAIDAATSIRAEIPKMSDERPVAHQSTPGRAIHPAWREIAQAFLELHSVGRLEAVLVEIAEGDQAA